MEERTKTTLQEMIIWILKKSIITLNYLNSKPAFFKIISKSIINNAMGKLCISTVWCNKATCLCWHFQVTNSKSWCNLKKGDNSNNWKMLRSGQKLGRKTGTKKCCICQLHYKMNSIELTSKLQNNFLYFGHDYCFG